MVGERCKLTVGKNCMLTAGADSRLIGSLGPNLQLGRIFCCWDGKRYNNVDVKTGNDDVKADVPFQIGEESNVK
jgi:hypothetical protein